MNAFADKIFGSAFRLAICIVAIALGTTCTAAVIGNATLLRDPSLGVPFATPDADLPVPWVSYALGLTATGPDQIQAVDIEINGQLHQRWTDPSGGGAYAATGGGTSKTNGDSHLLVPLSQLFFSGPTEDNPGTGSPLSAGNNGTNLYGVGTNLAGAFGPAIPATSLEIAYLVIPKGSERLLDVRVDVFGPSGSVIANLTTHDFFPIPEPTSVVLASVALLGLGTLRRQRCSGTREGIDK